MKKRINLPVAIISLILVILCGVTIVIPILRGNNELKLSSLRLESMDCTPDRINYNVKQYYQNHIEDQKGNNLGSGILFDYIGDQKYFDIPSGSEVSYTYPINITYTKLTGKIAAIKFIPKQEKANNIVHVEIVGDQHTIVYRCDWDVANVPELVIDEPLNRIRKLTINLSCPEIIKADALEIAMLDFIVSNGDEQHSATEAEIEAMNRALVGNWGGTYMLDRAFNTIVTIDTVHDGVIPSAVVTIRGIKNNEQICSYLAKGTFDYENRFLNLTPDHWIQKPNPNNNEKDYAEKYLYHPISAKLNEQQNIIRADSTSLIVKKLVDGGQIK